MARTKEKSADLVLAEVDKIRQEVRDLKKKIEVESDEARRAELKSNYDKYRKEHFRALDPDDEDTEDPTDKPPAPEEDGRWQLHKGGNKDPRTWKVVPMTRNPNMFKIVDNASPPINIADLYHTQANAQRDIDEAIKAAGGGTLPEPKPEEPIPKPPIPTPEPAAGDTPYPPKSPKMAATTKGPTVRHYASGKKDDFTYEKNVKEIEFKKYQAVFEINNNVDWAHDDTFSIKGGGTHMGTGWKDSGIKVFSGEVCLGYEPDHPETHLCEKKGPKVGDLRKKKFKIAWTYDNDKNYEEFWTDLGTGWVKQLDGTNVANFDPASDVDEVQLRIDGFKVKDKPPEVLQAFVTAI